MKFPTPSGWDLVDGPIPQAPILEKINVSKIPTFQEYTLLIQFIERPQNDVQNALTR